MAMDFQGPGQVLDAAGVVTACDAVTVHTAALGRAHRRDARLRLPGGSPAAYPLRAALFQPADQAEIRRRGAGPSSSSTAATTSAGRTELDDRTCREV
jgi:hypothetical protein